MSKKACAIICALYAAFILTVAILIFALPKPQISERENRMLAPFPELSLHSLSSRSFSEDFSAFCADRLPLREQLLSLNALRDLALGKQETRNVILRRDKGLVKHLEYSDLSPLKKNIDAIRRHSESFSEADPVFFCAPRAIDIFSDLCPSFFSGERCGSVWEKVGDCENITDELRRRANCGEYVFYSTDHHWTTLGAFYAYQSLGVSLGYIFDYNIKYSYKRARNTKLASVFFKASAVNLLSRQR